MQYNWTSLGSSPVTCFILCVCVWDHEPLSLYLYPVFGGFPLQLLCYTWMYAVNSNSVRLCWILSVWLVNCDPVVYI